MSPILDSRSRRAWQYPECPRCGTDVFVSTSSSSVYEYTCHFCEGHFDAAYQLAEAGRAT